MSRLERLVAASLAYRQFRARWRAGTAEPLVEWLAAHAQLGDVVDEAVLACEARAETSEGAAAVVDESYEASRFVGGFELLEELGDGAHGAVWRARRRGGEDVALKILHRRALQNGDLRRRFAREAQVASRFDHRNLCRVVEFDAASDTPWLAMRFVPGETLARKLRAQPGPATAAAIRTWVELVQRVATGLAAAHAQELVHRDVKPGNIIVEPDGTPVLVDFGLVREGGAAGQLTLTGDQLGTATYMSPEQVEGRNVDHRADVWALGVVLYECLAGQPPYVGPTPGAIGAAIVRTEAAPLRRLNPQVPEDLAVVVATALQKPLAQRYASAQMLADDLGRWLRGERVWARRPGRVVRVVAWSQRNPLPAALLVALAAALLATLYLAWREADAVRATDEARRRETAARQLAGAGQAARTYELARTQASNGEWEDAEFSYGLARDLGYDGVAVDLGLVEVYDARFKPSRSTALLEKLDARDDLAEHRDMVTLLRHDFSRMMVGSSKPSEWLRARKKVLSVVDSQTLPVSWREYARALVATDLLEARQHLENALRFDRRHRPANEMWGPVVLILDGPQAALEAARTFATLYPADPLARFMEALCLRLLGRTDEARACVEAAAIPPPVAAQIEVVAAVRSGARKVWKELVAQMIDAQTDPDARREVDFTGLFARAFAAVMGPPLQNLVDAQRRYDDADEEAPQILLRFPYATMEGLQRLAPVLLVANLAGGTQESTGQAMYEALPLPCLRGLRGIPGR